MFGQGNPYLKAGASEAKGENARLMNIMGAVSVADIVKTTLGPKGMDKILLGMDGQNGVRVTNDGATILKGLVMDNPAARILIDASKTQDDEVGDGTTSVTVLAGELLRNAEKLLEQSVHPQTIIEGYRAATQVALETLKKLSVDHGDNAEVFHEDLLKIARTTLSSKILTVEREHFAQLCVEAVMRLKKENAQNLELINIMKKIGGTMRDSFLEPGFLLNKKIGIGQPRILEDVKIMIANTPMDADKTKVHGAKVRVNGIAELADVEAAEKRKMREKCEKIIGHGINCFINRQLIYNYPEELFAGAGIMAIEHADFDGIDRLAMALDADILSTFEEAERGAVKFGHADRIDEMMIGGDSVIRFSGLPRGEACTIVLRGTSQHLLDEAERSLHDALCVVSQAVMVNGESSVIPGAGASEMAMAKAVEEAAVRTPGKKQLAMIQFANALKMLPTIIAENAGLDSNDLITRLQAAHFTSTSDRCYTGLDVNAGDINEDVIKNLGITESAKVKRCVVTYAAEAAEMILRVDDVLRAAPRQRTM